MSDDDMIIKTAALEAVKRETGFDNDHPVVAAIAALPAMTVGVRQLEWVGPRKLDEGGAAYDAHTTCGHYIATDTGWFLVGRSVWFVATSLETAKAAVQADFEARILAALEPVAALTPTPVDASQTPDPAVNAPAEDAAAKGETDGETLERLGMDGAKWAAEFRTTALRLGYSDMDEGWLIGWFCNAIMSGYDHKPAPDLAAIREAALREAADLADTTFSCSGTDAARIIRNAILALIPKGGA